MRHAFICTVVAVCLFEIANWAGVHATTTLATIMQFMLCGYAANGIVELASGIARLRKDHQKASLGVLVRFKEPSPACGIGGFVVMRELTIREGAEVLRGEF